MRLVLPCRVLPLWLACSGRNLLGYVVFSGWTYPFRDRQALRETANAQAKTLAQKRKVYSWICDHTPANAKIVAYGPAHMIDPPRQAGAGYWLVTDDDFSLEGERARITAREIEIASVLPMVFQSSDGFARLYDSSCLVSSTREDCASAQAVLFPGTP